MAICPFSHSWEQLKTNNRYNFLQLHFEKTPKGLCPKKGTAPCLGGRGGGVWCELPQLAQTRKARVPNPPILPFQRSFEDFTNLKMPDGNLEPRVSPKLAVAMESPVAHNFCFGASGLCEVPGISKTTTRISKLGGESHTCDGQMGFTSLEQGIEQKVQLQS